MSFIDKGLFHVSGDKFVERLLEFMFIILSFARCIRWPFNDFSCFFFFNEGNILLCRWKHPKLAHVSILLIFLHALFELLLLNTSESLWPYFLNALNVTTRPGKRRTAVGCILGFSIDVSMIDFMKSVNKGVECKPWLACNFLD